MLKKFWWRGERKEERREEGGREKGDFLLVGVLTHVSFIFVLFPLREEINKECELPKEASLSELTYVQLELN